MKGSTALYLVLGTFGLAAAVLAPAVITRSGTSGLPIWSSLASPGALSSAHAFTGTECESCHTPNQGITTAGCVTCHISDAVTLAKQSTAFHAKIGECKGCHIEHQGLDVRPVKMDHSVLTEAGVRAARAGVAPGQTATDAMAAARGFLADATGSKTATAGQAVPAQPPSPAATAIQHFLAKITGGGAAMDGQVLDCASCHNVLKAHQGLFGQQCADCHVTGSWQIASFLHPSAKSQECNQCHQAPPSHFMMHFQMVDQAVTGQRGARVEQCYLCHQTDAWNEIKGVGWLKHH